MDSPTLEAADLPPGGEKGPPGEDWPDALDAPGEPLDLCVRVYVSVRVCERANVCAHECACA